MRDILLVLGGLLVIPAFIVLVCVCEAIEQRLRLKDGLLMNLLIFIVSPLASVFITIRLYEWWKS